MNYTLLMDGGESLIDRFLELSFNEKYSHRLYAKFQNFLTELRKEISELQFVYLLDLLPYEQTCMRFFDAIKMTDKYYDACFELSNKNSLSNFFLNYVEELKKNNNTIFAAFAA